MEIETEVKFKVDYFGTEFPKSINNVEIIQTYYDCSDIDLRKTVEKILNNNSIDWNIIKEIRLRQSTSEIEQINYLTLKSDGNLERKEIEKIINNDEFMLMVFQKKLGHNIIKTRTTYKLNDDLNLELDCYKSNLKDLVMAEIEFDIKKYSRDDVTKLIYDFLGKGITDVTDNKKYKNKNLALIEKSSNESYLGIFVMG